MYPEMSHLPDFWAAEKWTDDKWSVYLERQERRSGFRKWFDQFAHRLMGTFLPEQFWLDREADQWPSKTGSYDPCEDHYNWLLGANRKEEAAALKEESVSRRPQFVKYLP
jgi:hypothetical protein